jgi:CRP-like cAMP-binding protein
MPKTSSQQDVSILMSGKTGLVRLTANDWALIADKAARMKFKAGDAIAQQGKRSHGLYVLLSGAASVHIPGKEILPSLQPGDVCGEISFLDEQPATVTVTAKDEVEAYYLDRPTLQSLFELYPHLGSRFFQSLAISLARRMRDVLVAGALVTKK